MNEQTVTLVNRPFRDLVDDILTAMVGGVVNEEQVFDVKAGVYPLAGPATAVRGITGTAGGAPRTFLPGVDFEFSSGNNAVVWLPDATRPDDASRFSVDYFRPDSRSPLTDINVGSVVRTLSEAVGREIATLYEQVNRAYRSGFVDTAEGTALDLVVSILGVVRKTAESAEGLVSFFRDASTTGNIAIPAGTVVTTGDGSVSFETTQPRTLQTGQARIDVPVRAGSDFAGDAGLVPAGAITVMAQPVVGIARVTNVDPTVRAGSDETDEELRLRAKAALRSLGKATLNALDRAIRETRGTPLEVFDPNSLTEPALPGHVAVVVDAEPERMPAIRSAVHETRAAGVVATLVARYVHITPRVDLTVAPGLTAEGQARVRADVVAALDAYVAPLTGGDPADGAAMLGAVKGVSDVATATIVDVRVARSDVAGVGPASLVDLLVGAAESVPAGDRAALRAALAAAVEAAPDRVPTGSRTPDRSLLLSTAEGRAGGEATDEDLHAGTFRVSATVGGEPWWIALDMVPDDVRLQVADG